MAALSPLLYLIILVSAVTVVRQFPTVGWLLLAFFAATALDVSPTTPLGSFGGIVVYPMDVVPVILLLAAMATSGPLGRFERGDLLVWLPVFALLLISLARGISGFGVAVAGNEARAFVALAMATLWCWNRRSMPTFDQELRRWGVITGMALTVVALFHISQHGLGSVDQYIQQGDDLVTSRPLVSTQALILALIGIALLVSWTVRAGKMMGLVFVAVAILCQHRSVWAATVVAVLALLVLVPAVRRRLIVLAILLGTALAFAYQMGLLDAVLGKFGLAFNDRGTLVDRQYAWRVLVDQQNALGGQTVLLGQPLGTGFARVEPDGTVSTYAPHNWYVLTYLRIGLVGAVLVAIAFLRGLWTNVRRRDAIGVAWAAGVMVYAVTYNLDWYLAPVIAVALCGRLAVPEQGVEPESTSDESVPAFRTHARSGPPVGYAQGRWDD